MNGTGARVVAEDFGWHHADREEPAFRGVDLDVAPGQKVLLLGPSGAGKSTFLHALAGVLDDEEDAASGRVLIDGREPDRARGSVGLMQQDPESSIVLSRVGDDVAFGPENLGVDPEKIVPRCLRALRAVGLDVAWDRPTSALSGGQKQRLGLAGVLAMEPGLLLLDEPTANLDPDGVIEVRDAVVRAAEEYGSTLIVVEHRVPVWAEYVDRVIVLRPQGGISHDGPPHEVLVEARDDLERAGVWVPGLVPRRGVSKDDAAGARGQADVLLEASDLSVSRETPKRSWTRARRREVARSPERPVPVSREAAAVASEIGLLVRRGEHLAITGRNGSGKSTLALTLAGLLAPVSGCVAATSVLRHCGDQDRPVDPRREPSWDPLTWSSGQLITRIGTVFQEPEHQFVTSTVRQELALGALLALRAVQNGRRPDAAAAAPCGPDRPEQRADRLMERLGLEHVAEANPFTLSGGEKRRLSVGTALAARPRILVLDEPTFGQDAITWASLVDLLREVLADGAAVVSVTHDHAFIEALGGVEYRLGDRTSTTGEPASATAGAQDSTWTC